MQTAYYFHKVIYQMVMVNAALFSIGLSGLACSSAGYFCVLKGMLIRTGNIAKRIVGVARIHGIEVLLLYGVVLRFFKVDIFRELVKHV